MTDLELTLLLRRLLSLPHETEWVEFKHNNADPDEIGEYLSALANSAAFNHQVAGFLVWGIDDATRQVVGTSFQPRVRKIGNEELENWLLRLLTPRIDFRIHEFTIGEHPVVIFEVPPTNHTPVRWKETEFIRVGSYKKKLKDFPEKERELWRMLSEPQHDWSAAECHGATFNDLDPRAIAFARTQYKVKTPALANEVDQWDDLTFLNKAKVCVAGRITRTSIILLGREEAEHFLSPAVARISWILKDSEGTELDYQHFGPPLLLNADEAFGNVRNLNYRYLRDASLFPTEVTKYDPWVIREALHNAIAHQDYSLGGRINLIEEDDSLLITNVGSFLPQSVERVIEQDAPHETYRNKFLTDAMVNLNMIDTIGSGIKRMYRKQRERFFPLPDFDLSDPQRVRVRIIGKVLDENYSRVLMNRTHLSLADVIALDKVQKRQPISDAEFRSLKPQRLVEGRRPNLFVSAKVAAVTGDRATYIRNRAFDKGHYKQLVISYLEKFGRATRDDIETLLMGKLSEALNEDQKRNQIKNLLQEMSKQDETIRKGEGSTRKAVWELSKSATGGVG